VRVTGRSVDSGGVRSWSNASPYPSCLGVVGHEECLTKPSSGEEVIGRGGRLCAVGNLAKQEYGPSIVRWLRYERLFAIVERRTVA
jgi:hypothetical protein